MHLIVALTVAVIVFGGSWTTRVARRLGTVPIGIVIGLAVVPSLGVAILADRGLAEASTLATHLGGAAALAAGMVLVAGRWRVRRMDAQPGVLGAPERAMRRLMAVVVLAVVTQVMTIGLPSLADEPELARWNSGSDVLFGVPGRLTSIGLALVFALGAVQYGGLTRASRLQFKAFAVLAGLYTAGLGFRSSVLELGVFLALALATAHRFSLNARTIRRGSLLMLPGLLIFAILTTQYTSEVASEQNTRGIAGAFVERLTVGTARSGVALLEYEPEQLGYEGGQPAALAYRDLLTLLKTYAGDDRPDNRLNERLSAAIAGADPDVLVAGSIAPATPGAVALAVYLAGVPLGYAMLVVMGLWFRLSMLGLRSAASVQGRLVALGSLYFLFQVLLKGNLEYQLVNVAAVLALLVALSGRVARLDTRVQRRGVRPLPAGAR